MSRVSTAAVGVRPYRLLLLVPVFLVATGIGCSGRRNAMRPVYVGTPIPAASADCPGGGDCSGSSAVITPGSASDSTSDFGPAPEVGTSGLDSSTETPPRASKGAPPVVTPPTTNPDNEPGLEPIDKGSSVPNLKSGSRNTAPKASLSKDSSVRRTAPARLRQTSVRDQVRQFVADENDLFQPPKADRPWKYIVLHHSANPEGSYDSIDKEHRGRLGWDGCGYHFIIGNGSESPDGQIEVSQRWRNQKLGVHCRDGKNPDINEYGIGICIVGDLDKTPPTPRQIEAAKVLVAYLESRYQISSDRAETHAHLASGPITCPGKLFPSDAIFVKKSSVAVVPMSGMSSN